MLKKIDETKLIEVYEKYIHFDRLLSDADWLGVANHVFLILRKEML